MDCSGPSNTLQRSGSWLRAPGIAALLIQLGALALVWLAACLVALAGVEADLLAWALVQGIVAALLSRLFRLAPWWWAIQLGLPVAVVATLALRIPPFVFLLAFLVLLSIYWSTFRTQVPFYPSGPKVWQAVAGLLPEGRPVRMVDIGSGLGGLVLHLAKVRSDSVFTGIELAPLPWLISVVRGKLMRSGARFLRGDYGQLDFSAYDVVFAYLSPAAMGDLWRKARTEMRPGALLLSYEFDIEGVKPDFVLVPAEGGANLYGWRM